MTIPVKGEMWVSRWRPESVVVTRHVRVHFDSLVRCITDGHRASERTPIDKLESPDIQRFSATPAITGWRARATLHRRGWRLVPLPPVEINVTAWSDTASEIRIVPLARLAHRWGTQHTRRYLKAATAVADWLIALCLSDEAVQTPAHPEAHDNRLGPA